MYLGIRHVARKRLAWMVVCALIVASLFRAQHALLPTFRHHSTTDIYNRTLGVCMIFKKVQL